MPTMIQKKYILGFYKDTQGGKNISRKEKYVKFRTAYNWFLWSILLLTCCENVFRL